MTKANSTGMKYLPTAPMLIEPLSVSFGFGVTRSAYTYIHRSFDSYSYSSGEN